MFQFRQTRVRVHVDGAVEHTGHVHVGRVVHRDAPASVVGRVARVEGPDVVTSGRVLGGVEVPADQDRRARPGVEVRRAVEVARHVRMAAGIHRDGVGLSLPAVRETIAPQVRARRCVLGDVPVVLHAHVQRGRSRTGIHVGRAAVVANHVHIPVAVQREVHAAFGGHIAVGAGTTEAERPQVVTLRIVLRQEAVPRAAGHQLGRTGTAIHVHRIGDHAGHVDGSGGIGHHVHAAIELGTAHAPGPLEVPVAVVLRQEDVLVPGRGQHRRTRSGIEVLRTTELTRHQHVAIGVQPDAGVALHIAPEGDVEGPLIVPVRVVLGHEHVAGSLCREHGSAGTRVEVHVHPEIAGQVDVAQVVHHHVAAQVVPPEAQVEGPEVRAGVVVLGQVHIAVPFLGDGSIHQRVRVEVHRVVERTADVHVPRRVQLDPVGAFVLVASEGEGPFMMLGEKTAGERKSRWKKDGPVHGWAKMGLHDQRLLRGTAPSVVLPTRASQGIRKQ